MTISSTGRDLANVSLRLSEVETLVCNAKKTVLLIPAEDEILSIKTELAGLEKSATSDINLYEQFIALTAQAEDVKTTLSVKLFFAERDFFRARNRVCDLTCHEQKGDAINDKYNFLAEIKGAEECITAAQKSVEIGKGIFSPQRKVEIQQELRHLSETVRAIKTSATTSPTQVEVDSPLPSPPPSPTKESPSRTFPEPVKEKTIWDQISDFFSSIGDFFSRLFTRLFS